jgi:DNA-binding transcriptional LysR family regulator
MRLQDMIGAQLLVAGRTGSGLTAKGQELARKLAALDQTLFDLSIDLKAESKDARGLVRISVTDGLGVFFLVPALRQFSVEHPHIQVAIQSPRNLNDLRQNQSDMMLGFAVPDAMDVTSRPIGTLHLVPVASREYVDRYGVPTRSNVGEHLFLQSGLYQSTEARWRPWTDLVERGRAAHYCENPLIYGMMVKAGHGIGLIGNYTMMEPAALPPELGIHIALPMHALVMTERLSSKPVQLAYDWICELFGTSNPWFSHRLNLTPQPSPADEGFRVMFNLPQLADASA